MQGAESKKSPGNPELLLARTDVCGQLAATSCNG